MRASVNLMLLLLAGVSLSGCGGAWERHMQASLPAPQPVGVSPDKAIVVADTRSVHEVGFAAGSASLSDAEEAFLASFLEQRVATKNQDLTVLVERPSAKAAKIEAQRAATVTSYLKRKGFKIAPFTPDNKIDANVMRIAVDTAVAVAPNCPDWSVPKHENFAVNPHSNYGCSDRANLAAMIAQPRDLVVGAVPSGRMGPAPILGQNRYDTGAVIRPEVVNND